MAPFFPPSKAKHLLPPSLPSHHSHLVTTTQTPPDPSPPHCPPPKGPSPPSHNGNPNTHSTPISIYTLTPPSSSSSSSSSSSFNSASDHLEMGRGKIEIKRIENSANRQVTYSKRKTGILKKAKEISVLCNADVSLIIFSSSGKMSEFCTPKTTLSRMLERYQQNSGKRIWDAKHENLSAEIDRIKKENDNMQIELRHLKGEDLNSLNPRELQPIEDALQKGLAGVREKQMDILKMMRKNERILEEENRQLSYMLHRQLALDGTVRELQHNYHHNKERDFSSQIPLAFHVQPIQPNLRENK